MSDINQQEDPGPGAPVESDVLTDTAQAELDANIELFMGHGFQAEERALEAQAAEKAGNATEADTNSGGETTAGSAGDDTLSGADNADGTASAPGPDAVQPVPEPTPAELAAMLGHTEETPTAESTTAAPAAATEETFKPFQPNFKLPPAMVAGIFEAEDTETREQNLVNLLAAYGNTIVQVMEARIAEHHAPRLFSDFTARQSAAQVGQGINQHFYGTEGYPELQGYGPAVKKAFEIVAKQVGADKPYDDTIRAKVGELVHATLKAQGITLERKGAGAKTAPKPAAKPKAAAAVKSTPVFEAGAGRPGGGVSSQGDSGPADLLSQLSQF